MTLLDIDPNLVKPGWTPLIILIVLAVVVALLYFSMKRQIGKINVPGDQRRDVEDLSSTPPTLRD